jgi:phage terminase large subunit
MPHLKVNRKLEPFIRKSKPIKVAIGGRGSGKSIGFGDIFTMKMETERCDIYCLREFQDSIEDSVHRVFVSSIQDRLKLEGWQIFENKVVSPWGNRTRYKGAARSPDSIQSAQGYKYSWYEEAHRASDDSLNKLLPTILRNPGAECWFAANPQSSEDAFSKRFIVPYLKELEANGYYEDDLHLIIVLNWRDNPWWSEEQEVLRKWDYENRPRSEYDWIWEGKFNDSIESAIIQPEWFDACIDAHKSLGIEARGAKIASHDPSDVGADTKGYAMRHGSVVMDIQEKADGNVNAGARWAADIAIKQQVDAFSWDSIGMGAGLAEQFARDFDGKHVRISMFNGAESPDFPDSIYKPAIKASVQDQKTNKQVFRNKRAQYYFELRDRIYNTYRAVVHKEYGDPDAMISFCSEIPLISKLRAELCRLPIKHNGNGLNELYTKEEMRSKFKIASPNLADAVMQTMRYVPISLAKPYIPPPVRAIGRR